MKLKIEHDIVRIRIWCNGTVIWEVERKRVKGVLNIWVDNSLWLYEAK
jgi:hypothetical protein